jgi:threonine dehydratase
MENLQPINAYKPREPRTLWQCCLNQAQARRVDDQCGNAGQGVAYAARQAGVPCTVVVIETAPKSKLERMRALGAKLIHVSYDVTWKALEERSFPGAEGTFVHPFDDHNFIAGHATMGLEILEDAPNAKAVIASIGGAVDSLRASAARSNRSSRRSKFGASSRRRPRPPRFHSKRDLRKCSRISSSRSSMAPAARACSRGCGSG